MPSALSEALVQPAVRARPASGYLTMEQTRKLLPLGEGDPKAFEVPLVGVWVAGTADAAAPLAWAAAARFASLRDSGRAVTAPNGAFLLLHYAAEPPAHAMAPKLYEVAPQLSDTPYTLVSGAIEIDPTNLDTADAPAVVCELGVTVSAPLTEAMRAAGVWNPPPAQPLTDKELRGSEAWLAAIAARSRDPEPTPPKPPAAAKAPVGAAPPPAEEAPRPPTEWTDPVAAVAAAAGGGSEVASLLLSMQAQIVALTSQVEAQQKTIAELSKRPKGKSVARQLLAETASYGAGASSGAPAPAPARDAAAELEEVMRRYGIGSAAPPAKKAASPAKAKAAAKAASPAKAAPAAKAPPAPTAAAAAYDDDYVDVKDDDNDSDFDDDSDDEPPLRVPTGAEAPGRSGTPVYSSLVASEVPRIVYDAVGDIDDDDELDEEEEEEEEEEVGAGPAMRFGE